MSYRLTSTVLRAYKGPPTARLVLAVLADCANGFGLAWPGVALLAERSGLSERRIRQLLAQLEREGSIEAFGSRKGGQALAVRWKVADPAVGRSVSRVANPEAHFRVEGRTNPEAHFRVPGGKYPEIFDTEPRKNRHGTLKPISAQAVRSYQEVVRARKHTQESDVGAENRKSVGENSTPKPNGSGPGRSAIPRVPAKGDQAGIERAARTLGLWPLEGAAGRSYDAAHDVVVREIARRHRGDLPEPR